MHRRVVILFLFVAFLWMALIGRAAYLQIIPSEKLRNLKQRQFNTAITLDARRGDIRDRHGKELASSVAAYSVFADPKMLEKPRNAARALAKILPGSSWLELFHKMKQKEKRFVWLERRIDRDTRDKIAALKISGISFIEESKRLYPNAQVLSQVLGFIGQQGTGLGGLESRFEAELSGESKKVELKKDARGVPLILNGQLFTQRPHGFDLQLTVDLELQYTLEQELKSAMETYEADSAVGIILQADSSEVLAMASYPTFDPNQYQRSTQEQKRDRAVSDPFEPGSTMKAFTIAGAIRDKIVSPHTRINCENGKFKVGPYWIHEADSHHSFQSLTVTEILEKSSNVGTSKVALKMGDQRLLETLKDFGFGEKYDMGLPGESRGIIPSIPWRPHMLANISFGHTIAATPLQIANAYAAIANGGVLRQPYVVQEISDIEGNEIEKYSAKDIRRVLSPADAQKMVQMLEAVTGPEGTGQNARVEGFRVAGKTGTAQKIDPVNGGYLRGAYISSFAGFIPANAPKYVIYVAVDNPRKSFYGAEVAAPIFSRVASFAMMKEGTLPSLTKEQRESRKRNNKITSDKNRKAIDKVVRQATNVEDMPDVVGISLREALQVLQRNDMDLKVYGQGQVQKTEPAAGEKLAKAQTIKIFLSRDE